ncbi:neutral trehalase [Cokeromyces recurvatus]|uniref:neutral trehalase n=1 Tax=Cokeromyces recurvatus TaxID=90255 RepID=UPI0022208153|nr:neutral trehalase [Cokeromyces recurvatus]KAI7906734.1 neutral trehalase [Cokeromyces recurvatus]
MQSTIHVITDQNVDVHAPAKTYYTTGSNAGGFVSRLKNYKASKDKAEYFIPPRKRRASHDDKNKAQKFLIDVKETQRILVEQEDTDGDFQITVNDLGPKSFAVGTADSGGYRKIEIRGTYMLSNLLQELALADDYGRKHIVLDEARLNENPVDRLSRTIRHHFWDGLTRRIDADGLDIICADPKNRSAKNHNPRIYIPYSEDDMFEYYREVAIAKSHLNLEVERLPKEITHEFVKSINDRPGILALAMKKEFNNQTQKYVWQGVPFIVPGGRFNEMYGWDSYFEVLGLLIDGRIELAQSMVDNFVYQIKHYGKILNANRSYYLCRSQPPFLTDMALRVYKKLDHSTTSKRLTNTMWLANVFEFAIREYNQVWISKPRYDEKTGLSRFRPEGLGIPPETEASHFDHVIQPYATAANLSIKEYMDRYNDGSIKEPLLDDYFLHDRAVRESGHDTTYRYEKVCANLATVDLNTLLYKYEMDIADAIDTYFDGELSYFTETLANGQSIITRHHSKEWREKAKSRKEKIDKYLWNEEKGLYFDYDTVLEKQTNYESVTTLWTMWAKCASKEQAKRLIKSLYKFEALGGLVSGTKESRGVLSLDRPNRQWDFPFGWAPHQIMAWQAFENYGRQDIAERLAYRWLYTITKSFVDFNGVVPEKYDVVGMTHKVEVEYGNVGVEFKYVPREGFGWMNASYQIGLSLINTKMRRALGTCIHPDLFFEKTLLSNNRQSMDPEEASRLLEHRKSAEAAARKITHNGQITAAITRIDTTYYHEEPIGTNEVQQTFLELTEPSIL